MPGVMPDQIARQMGLQRTNAAQLDAFNQSLRANPQYQALLRAMGVNPSGPVRLTPDQRKQAEAWVRANVGDIGKLEIDPAGNVNQNEGFLKQAGDYAVPVASTALALFGVPGLFSGALNGGGSAIPALGNVNGTIDALSGAAAGAPALASTGAAAASRGVLDRITDPKSLAALAALGIGGVTSLTGQQHGPVDNDAISDEIAKSLALQRSRVEQAQPAYDTLVRMAYGMSPTAYRGAAPAGYTAPASDNPAYAYQSPRFGGR